MASHSQALLDYARILLQDSPSPSTPLTHPLSVLLFLLDVQSFVQHEASLLSKPAEAVSSDQIDRLRIASTDDDEFRSGDPSAADGEREAARRWTRRGAGSSPSVSPELGRRILSCSSPRTNSSVDGGQVDETYAASTVEVSSEWFDYMSELYLLRSGDNEWISPFYLDAAIVPSLRALISIGCDIPTAHQVAQLTIDEATSYLIDLAQRSPALRSFTSLASMTASVECLPREVFSSISNSLAIRRASSSNSTASTLTFRFVLTSILSHHFGVTSFSQEIRRNGEFMYSRDDGDDRAIRHFWQRSMSHHMHQDDDVEERDAPSDGVEIGRASIQKKDEKLRRVLGDNFRTGFSASAALPAAALSTSPPSSSKRSSGDHSPILFRHERIVSTSSSNDPLMSTLPKSPAITFNETIEETFGNFDLVSPSTPQESSTSRSETSNVNSLTPEERRNLVKRSKKLGGIFGVPLEEGALSFEPVAAGAHRRRSRSLERGKMDGHDAGTIGFATAFSADPTNLQSFELSRHRIQSSSVVPRRQSFPPSPIASPLESDQMYSPSTFDCHSPFSSSLQSPSTSQSQLTLEPISPKAIPITHQSSSTRDSTSIGSSAIASQEKKEERRRKIAKLHNLLGERVPAHLALSEERGQVSTSSSMVRGNSSRLGEILKGAGEKLGWTRKDETEAAIGERFVVVDAPLGDVAVTHNVPAVGSVAGLMKTRKLEQLFGDVPPPSLYLSRSIVLQRRSSDTPSLSSVSPNLIDTPPADQLIMHRPDSTGPLESAGSRESDAGIRYRRSIASLRYLLEQEPASLDSIAQEYSVSSTNRPAHRYSTASTGSIAGSEYGVCAVDESASELRSFLRDSVAPIIDFPSSASSTASEFSPSPPPMSSNLPTQPLFSTSIENDRHRHHRRSLSVGSHRRTLARAAKLSNIFGTSQIWKVLLLDLENVIKEEADMEESEREEVLEDVARLRMEADGC